MPLKELVLKYAPIAAQNAGISIYNSLLYRQRHTGQYDAFGEYFRRFEHASPEAIQRAADRRWAGFLDAATRRSAWYAPHRGKPLHEFPILEKSQLMENMDTIRTIDEKDGIISLTGGTTGASMKVVYTHQDMQERFALKDHF